MELTLCTKVRQQQQAMCKKHTSWVNKQKRFL